MRSWQKKLLCLLPAGAAAAGICLRPVIFRLADYVRPCSFRAVTGYLCPGCGNTRSVLALLHGDLLQSLCYNITPVTALLLGLGFYAEMLFRAWGSPRRIVPRSPRFWWSFGIFMAVYFLARNFFPALTCAWN